MPEIELKAVRTRAGVIHEVAIVRGDRLDRGQCNLDDVAGGLEEVSQGEVEAAEPAALCGHCYPGRVE